MRAVALLSYLMAAMAAWIPYAAVKYVQGPEWALTLTGGGAIAVSAIALFVMAVVGGWNG